MVTVPLIDTALHRNADFGRKLLPNPVSVHLRV
jgi:hypothetical protein